MIVGLPFNIAGTFTDVNAVLYAVINVAVAFVVKVKSVVLNILFHEGV
jgi:hypothetical protein